MLLLALTNSLGSCIVWTFLDSFVNVLSGAVSRCLLLLRVFALYDRRRSVFLFLGTLFIATNTVIFVTTLLTTIQLKGEHLPVLRRRHGI